MLPASHAPALQHRRIHSPAPLDMWLPAKYSCSPPSRPSLRDLPPNLPSVLPLTPPLTPASTRRSDSDAAHSSRSNSFHFDSPTFPPSYPLLLHASPDPPPALHHYSPPDPSVLPSPTSPIRPHPLVRGPEPHPASRFLFVSGVPRDASSHGLKQAFLSCGDLKGIFVRFQPDHGAIVLAFYDIRHTLRAHRQINARSFFDGACLQAHFISADDLRDLIGQSNFVNANDGALRISTSPAGPAGELDPPALQNVLASFGELRTFSVLDTHAKTYYAEFFDSRDATSALNALDGRVILRERLHLAPATVPAAPAAAPSPIAELLLQQQQQNTVPFPTASADPMPRTARRLSVDSSFPAHPSPAPAHPLHHGTPEQHPAHTHARRTSNIYHFDCVGKAPAVLRTPPRPRSISVQSEAAGLGLVLREGEGEAADDETGEYAHPHESEGMVAYAGAGEYGAPEAFYEYEYAAAAAAAAATVVPVPPTPAVGPRIAARRGHSHGHGHGTPVDMPPERNRIDIARIERGDDTRTTVMIKNIPNKMSDRHLIDFINEVCPRKIDFLYLRMDFTNGCNVGYAFVNFIHVEDLLHFAKVKLGTKWNLFSSEKILGMSYANYQGKEALIDKFRSSSIMDQREAWRPKLFYSAGPKKGLSEEFPAPTHVRRKERERERAGAGAGVGAGTGAGGALFHHHHHHAASMRG